jgi:hypothetical protein
MSVFAVKIISGAVQILWYDAAVVPSKLPVEALAKLDAGVFCNSVRLICGL